MQGQNSLNGLKAVIGLICFCFVSTGLLTVLWAKNTPNDDFFERRYNERVPTTDESSGDVKDIPEFEPERFAPAHRSVADESSDEKSLEDGESLEQNHRREMIERRRERRRQRLERRSQESD